MRWEKTDVPLNCHPAAVRVSGVLYAKWRGWSNGLSAELVGVPQPIVHRGEVEGVGRGWAGIPVRCRYHVNSENILYRS